jgi:NADPH-dependent glutamate synthase beta subunit-like oxidoreductase
MVASCGEACPSDRYCAAACTRAELDTPIRIRELHRYATRMGERAAPRPLRHAPRSGQRVAVVGGGPAGLTCALELRRLGVDVVLHEARSTLGGVLAHAIPLDRFPDETIAADGRWVVERAIDAPATLEVRLNHPIEEPAELAAVFDAVYIAPGAVPREPRIPGSDLGGVMPAIAFLEACRRRRYRQRVGRRVVVVGGGNVAVDAAMAVVRCGLEGGGAVRPRVHLVYRRARRDMPAWEREMREAEELGIELHLLAAPLAFLGHAGRVEAVRLQTMRPGPLDGTGRPAPEPVPGAERELACDQVILATGLELDRRLTRLPRTRSGWIRAHERTRRVGGMLYAGGDAIGSDQAIVTAVGDGKAAAAAIVAALRRKR